MSIKGPTVKRILKEAAELSTNPSPDYHAAPLESDLYQWHFTLRGPPSPSPFAGGIYHGQITLPPSYPLKPPNFRFLTPSGRFETNREICLSISGHHEESWQPAWGIRTALVAIRSFMDSDAGGQVGGMSAPDNVRRKLAQESRESRCRACGGRSNNEILSDQEELCERDVDAEGDARRKEEEHLAKAISFAPSAEKSASVESTADAGSDDVDSAPITTTTTTSTPTRAQQQHSQLPHAQPQTQAPIVSRDIWLDRAIIGIFCALIFMLLRRVY